MTPILIVNPVTDGDFADEATAALESAERPDVLEARLRSRYPRVVVRPSVLSAERLVVWYVYRDGRWISS